MKQLEGDKETIEDVVGGEELDEPGSIIKCRVENPSGVNSTPKDIDDATADANKEKIPGDDPNNGEDHKDSITSFPIAGVPKHLGQLQQVVGTVVDNHHQRPYPSEVGCPGEHQEGDGGVVVDEHFPEVLPLNIKELADGQ